MNATTNTHITHLGAVIIPTKDHDAAIAFWTEKLGFQKGTDVGYAGDQRWVEVAPPGGQTKVALAPLAPDGSGAGTVNNAGFATDDVEASHAELKARGVDVDDDILRLGDPVPPMFWFRDLEGNSLLVVERED
jgi:catechol 2,3-dioxygenase-like lactoylglutathione lyase family enzyme